MLPDDAGVILRLDSGEVLVYDERPGKHPVSLRAVVMPDGNTQVFPGRRFFRRASPGRRASDPHPSRA